MFQKVTELVSWFTGSCFFEDGKPIAGAGLQSAPAMGLKDFICLNYFFGFALVAAGFLGAGAAAAGSLTFSNSTSKTSVEPPGMIGGLP